jgi:hypothetical protein
MATLKEMFDSIETPDTLEETVSFESEFRDYDDAINTFGLCATLQSHVDGMIEVIGDRTSISMEEYKWMSNDLKLLSDLTGVKTEIVTNVSMESESVDVVSMEKQSLGDRMVTALKNALIRIRTALRKMWVKVAKTIGLYRDQIGKIEKKVESDDFEENPDEFEVTKNMMLSKGGKILNVNQLHIELGRINDLVKDIDKGVYTKRLELLKSIVAAFSGSDAEVVEKRIGELKKEMIDQNKSVYGYNDSFLGDYKYESSEDGTKTQLKQPEDYEAPTGLIPSLPRADIRKMTKLIKTIGTRVTTVQGWSEGILKDFEKLEKKITSFEGESKYLTELMTLIPALTEPLNSQVMYITKANKVYIEYLSHSTS